MKDSRFTAKNLFKAVIFSAASLITVSCSSIPETLPETPREIVQLEQNASDAGNTKLAKWYYVQLLNRYGDDPAIYIEGNFEIAHLDIKKKNYEEAVPRLNEIIRIYDNVAPGMLPGQYRKLAQKDLEKIPEEKLVKINADLKAREKAAKEAAEKVDLEESAEDDFDSASETDSDSDSDIASDTDYDIDSGFDESEE